MAIATFQKVSQESHHYSSHILNFNLVHFWSVPRLTTGLRCCRSLAAIWPMAGLSRARFGRSFLRLHVPASQGTRACLQPTFANVTRSTGPVFSHAYPCAPNFAKTWHGSSISTSPQHSNLAFCQWREASVCRLIEGQNERPPTTTKMCRVVYVHFACGHSDIVSTPCELAQDLPFYLKHACANYTGPVSMNPPSLCGRGKYYCGKAPVDGVFLNGVHMTLERRQGTLLQIDQKIALLKQRAREFTEAANRNNITLDARRKHPAYGVINNNYGFLMQQRSRIDYDRRKVTHVIKHAIEFFRERRELAAQQAALGFQPAFTLPPGAGSIPMEYAPAGSFNNTGFDMPMAAPGIPLAESGNPMAAAGIPMAAQPMAMTQQAIDVSQGTQMPEQTISHLTPSGGSNIDVIHVRRDTDPLTTPGQAATPNLTPQKALQPDVLLVPSDSGLKSAAILKRVIKQNSNTSGPRRRKPASPAKPSPAPAEDRNIVRRSDRVRTKKVTYAESQTSDFSRDSSPDKYEEESPVKSISEWSESPEPVSRRAKKQQRKPQRSVHGGNESNRSNNVTLASKIGDWKRRKGDTTDDTSGKSTSAQYASGKCERAAGQQEDAQSTGSACTSSKLWKAPRSQHSQVMMQGTAPSASTRQGTFSSGISAPQPPHSNSMQASLGRPFPDNTNEAAVFGPNLFNTYLQQSWPGGHHRSQPTQAWSVQQNAQNPSQQQTMMAGNNMQSATDFGQTQPPLNNQYIGGVDNFTTPSGPSNAALASAMQAMAPYFAATKAASTQQGVFPHGSDGYVGGYTPNPVSGLQTPSDSRADSVIYPEANCLSDIDVETYFDYVSTIRAHN